MIKLLAGLASACALGVSGCAALGGSPVAATTNGADLLNTVKAISSNCAGTFTANLTFAPPLPPSGSLAVNQTCAAPAVAAAAKAVSQP
ncbi:MAG: hypothetical protein JSR98_00420 [Proteobacteria bacterium]|nr:hypothetical protein [Pseudomonadota bacterium]